MVGLGARDKNPGRKTCHDARGRTAVTQESDVVVFPLRYRHCPGETRFLTVIPPCFLPLLAFRRFGGVALLSREMLRPCLSAVTRALFRSS
jgi:hypothetical protein